MILEPTYCCKTSNIVSHSKLTFRVICPRLAASSHDAVTSNSTIKELGFLHSPNYTEQRPRCSRTCFGHRSRSVRDIEWQRFLSSHRATTLNRSREHSSHYHPKLKTSWCISFWNRCVEFASAFQSAISKTTGNFAGDAIGLLRRDLVLPGESEHANKKSNLAETTSLISWRRHATKMIS